MCDLRSDLHQSQQPTLSLVQLLRSVPEHLVHQCYLISDTACYCYEQRTLCTFERISTLLDELCATKQIIELQAESLQSLLKNKDGFQKLFYFPVLAKNQVRAVFELGYYNSAVSMDQVSMLVKPAIDQFKHHLTLLE